jgi:uroporphyrinogen-III synthase
MLIKEGPYFVWTRSEEDHAQDLISWQQIAGFEPHLVPCLNVVSLPESEWILPPFSLRPKGHTVIVTSARSVKIVDESPLLKPYLTHARQCITHGAKTGAKLEDLGYQTKIVENIRTARDLAQWVTKNQNLDEELVFISPSKPAFNMVGFLRDQGFKINPLICYETTAQVPPPFEKKLVELLAQDPSQRRTIWCFASPSAIEGLMATSERMGLKIPTPFGVAVIGPTTEEASRKYFQNSHVSNENTIESLIRTALDFVYK